MPEIIILGSSSAKPFPRTEKNKWADYKDIGSYFRHFRVHDCEICQSAKKGGKDRRTRSAFAIETREGDILFDAGPDIFYQIKKYKIKPVSAFISHEHTDANEHAEDLKKIGVKIYSEKEKNIKPGQKISMSRLNLDITPFRVRHAKNVKTVGYQIDFGGKKVAVATDTSSPAGLKKYFTGSDVVFADGSGLAHVFPSHMTIKRQLSIYKKWKLKKVYFTHIGHDTLPHAKLSKFVKNFYPNADIAYDGMKIKI